MRFSASLPSCRYRSCDCHRTRPNVSRTAGAAGGSYAAHGLEQLELLRRQGRPTRTSATAADQIVATGMKDAGYIYVNIDDTWEGERDANGVLHTNSKFPDMKALADYVHSKGLKIGIYSSPGPKTCAGYDGSLGHEEQDAQLYASWGIDYLKYDLCSFIPRRDGKAGAQRQGRADAADDRRLRQDGQGAQGHRPPHRLLPLPVRLGRGVGVGARRSAAISGAPPATSRPHWQSIYAILSEQAGLANYAGPGHWNDPDMLEVGNGKLSLAENRTHFSMWAMLAAPLLAGNDLPNMKPEIKAILTNRDVIAIDQDPLGHQARHIYSDGEVEVWTRDLSGGAKGHRRRQRRQRRLLNASVPSGSRQARPARPAAREGSVDRQGDGPDQQHAHRTPQPRHSAA